MLVYMKAWGNDIQHFGMYQITMRLDILLRPKCTINPSMQCTLCSLIETTTLITYRWNAEQLEKSMTTLTDRHSPTHAGMSTTWNPILG